VKHTIVAKRYAKALFAVGKEEGKLEEFSRSLNTLAAIYAEVPVVLDALTNPLYPMEVRGKVMEHLASTVEADQLMKNFLDLLVQKKRAEALDEIAEQFQNLVDDDQNICRGTVVAATELSEELQARVQSTLEKITGKKVILTSEVEPAIIGGMIAKVGDLVLDGSIKSQLAGLNESIKGSE
jgi:F-type H+-transporting ATPase subunit delta